MIELDEATLADYVASGDWRGKAGAYALQGMRRGARPRGPGLGHQRDRAAAGRGARRAARAGQPRPHFAAGHSAADPRRRDRAR